MQKSGGTHEANHLVVELIAEDDLMGQLHPVGLHGMGRSEVELPGLGIVKVAHAMLDPRPGTRHAFQPTSRWVGLCLRPPD